MEMDEERVLDEEVPEAEFHLRRIGKAATIVGVKDELV